MPEYSEPKKVIWYDDIPKEYGLTVAELWDTMENHFGLVPCPGI